MRAASAMAAQVQVASCGGLRGGQGHDPVDDSWPTGATRERSCGAAAHRPLPRRSVPASARRRSSDLPIRRLISTVPPANTIRWFRGLRRSRQAPGTQHALDRVGRGLDRVALAVLGGGDQSLDRAFEQTPAFDVREPLGEQIRGIAQRHEPRPIVEYDPAREFAIIVRGAARRLGVRALRHSTSVAQRAANSISLPALIAPARSARSGMLEGSVRGSATSERGRPVHGSCPARGGVCRQPRARRGRQGSRLLPTPRRRRTGWGRWSRSGFSSRRGIRPTGSFASSASRCVRRTDRVARIACFSFVIYVPGERIEGRRSRPHAPHPDANSVPRSSRGVLPVQRLQA